ncbi:sulfite exporter TauE/SafE family protein, partial [Acidithiobacillus ferrooxidans]|nr:sulfite exporter TauE/SafE family protein [Acidithiobacillus ferrooxidans]
MNIVWLYLFSGAVAGIISGMLGVGGGIVLVPILIFIFGVLAIPVGMAAHMAIGTSLSTIIFTSMSAIHAQHRRKAIDWNLVRKLAPATILGSLISGYLAGLIPGQALKAIFGVFLAAAAVQMFFEWRPAPYRTLPGPLALLGIGTGIGALSAMLGIGGGTLTVPFFNWCNVD